jgi:hypothetical protein
MTSIILRATIAVSGALSERLPAHQQSLVATAKAYRIEVNLTPSFPAKTKWGVIEGREPEPRNVERYAPLFVREFSLLPATLVEKAKLKRVIFCEELAFAGQRRNAVPDFEHEALYLEVARGAHHPRYLAAVIHHDFFHMVDFRDDGKLYKDDAWSALNPKGFKYGDGGKNWQHDGKTTNLTDKHPGFLTHYMTTGVEEDKAELFAQLLVRPSHVHARCNVDPVLRAKVARLKTTLADFCPEIDDAFWRKAERMDRPGM